MILKKPARKRYRSVADRIRKAEAQLLMARWNDAETALATSDETLKSARLTAADRTEEAAKCAALRAEAAATLPPLREIEVTRAAEFQRLSIGRDELGQERA